MATRPTVIEEPPPGLRYVSDFVSAEEEPGLVDAIARLPFEAVVMRGVAAHRTVVHYGRRYGYDSWALDPAPELPSFLWPLRALQANP